MPNPSFWQQAQKNELELWETTAGSVWRIVSELNESGELESFIESKLGGISLEGKRVLELGVGPLGIGWVGLFGPSIKADNIAVEPLPILTVNSGLAAFDEFIRSLQGRVTVHRGKGEHLEFETGSFDIVVCNDVIDHVSDYQLVLQECLRVLKKGGLFIFSVNVFSEAGSIKWNYYTRKLHPRDKNVLCHPHSFTYSRILKLLKQRGLTVTHSNRSLSCVRENLLGKAKKARFLCVK